MPDYLVIVLVVFMAPLPYMCWWYRCEYLKQLDRNNHLSDENHRLYTEKDQAKEEADELRIKLKLTKLYIDDDEAILELLECHQQKQTKSKSEIVHYQPPVAYGLGLQQAALNSLADAQRVMNEQWAARQRAAVDLQNRIYTERMNRLSSDQLLSNLGNLAGANWAILDD